MEPDTHTARQPTISHHSIVKFDESTQRDRTIERHLYVSGMCAAIYKRAVFHRADSTTINSIFGTIIELKIQIVEDRCAE